MYPNNDHIEWSLFLRSLNNMMTMLDRIYLEQDATGYTLSQDELEKTWEGVKRFNEVMHMISKKNAEEHGNRYKVPYIVKFEGHA